MTAQDDIKKPCLYTFFQVPLQQCNGYMEDNGSLSAKRFRSACHQCFPHLRAVLHMLKCKFDQVKHLVTFHFSMRRTIVEGALCWITCSTYLIGARLLKYQNKNIMSRYDS
ncbi:hypothetical protein E2C01_080736 [Portunus trituberculatus]|uniref:Uncharacterized protein n=1 Tax=Portunus trituberculatus TaxID=210409 RepID=A0A5B7IMX9_PORTR|nr:hypothetical protein [Portunus trituberculatus]